MEKNNYIEGLCTGYTHDGQGIVKIDKEVIFVKQMVQGETGMIKIIKSLKGHSIGRLTALDHPSIERTKAPCLIYKACGGCHIQHMSPTEQQRFKTSKVQEAMKRIAKIETEVLPTIMMDNPWNYRNKGQVPIRKQDNKLVSGFYKAHSHEVIDMEECLIQDERISKLVQIVKGWMGQYKISAYDEVKHTGMIRHVMVRVGYHTDQVMLVLVVQKMPDYLEELETMIKNEGIKLDSFYLNFNKEKTNVILGKRNQLVSGKDTIQDSINGLVFNISVHSFYQVNPIQVEVLYTKAIELANITNKDHVLDVYCGIGTISLMLARMAKHVTGVEIVEQAIMDANDNAKLNNITNTTFICNDASVYMKENRNEFDVVFVDPPRKGLQQDVIESLNEMNVKRLVYISCDVATLARDLEKLKEFYSIKVIQPVDMFPQTHHVETIVMMERLG